MKRPTASTTLGMTTGARARNATSWWPTMRPPVRDVGQESDEPRAHAGGHHPELESIHDRRLRRAVLEKGEGEVRQGEVVPSEWLGPGAGHCRLRQNAVGQEDGAGHDRENGEEGGPAPGSEGD